MMALGFAWTRANGLAWITKDRCSGSVSNPTNKGPRRAIATFAGSLAVSRCGRNRSSSFNFDPEQVAVGLGWLRRSGSREELAAEERRLDVVTAMEVVEHAADPNTLHRHRRLAGQARRAFCSSRLSTAHLRSFAPRDRRVPNNVLRWLEPGTHHWEQFVTQIRGLPASPEPRA